MKCSDARRLLLDAPTADAKLAKHLAECDDCAGAAELVSRLRDRGSAIRAGDLSPETIRATRARVAEVLAAQQARSTTPAIAWPLRLPALAAAAAVVLIAGTALFFFDRKGLPEHPTAAELAMQDEMTELRCSIMDRLDTFRATYQVQKQGAQFSARRGRLQARLNVCLYELNQDLDEKRTPRPVPGRLPDDADHALNVIQTKEGTQDEDTTQDEPNRPRGAGSPGNTVALADNTGTGTQI